MGNNQNKKSFSEENRLEGNRLFKEINEKQYSNYEKMFLARTSVNIYETLLSETTQEKEKYKLHKNLGLSYSKIIQLSDYYSRLININTLNDFMKSFTEMAKHYSNALVYGKTKLNKETYQELLKSVENKCLEYFRLLAENEHISYMELIPKEFDNLLPLKYSLTAYISRYYFINALKLYEEKQHAKSKGVLYKVKEIINNSYTEKTKNVMSTEIQDIFCDTLESVIFYINRNTIVQLLDNGISLYNFLPKVQYEQFLQKEEETSNPDKNKEEEEKIEDIKLNALSYFRDALNELMDLENNSNGIADIELEAICRSYLGQLLVSFKDKQIEKIKALCGISIHLGLSLAPKDVSTCDWFKNAQVIFNTIMINENENLRNESYAEIIKKETIYLSYKEIFEELDAKSPKNSDDDNKIIEYCQFILKKYPHMNYKPKNVKEEIKKDKKKFIRDLSFGYHPDRYPKETEEDFKNYVIMEHISKEINLLYTYLKG